MGLRCTLASDLYSFGVVLLELTTGQLLRSRGAMHLPQAPRDCPQVGVPRWSSVWLELLCTRSKK